MLKRLSFLVSICALILSISVLGVQAGERVLSINSGTVSAPWFISGEASLVMNGFDLNALGVALPAVIDRVSIDVDTPVPGASIDVVVYQDGNGGSPVDATLVGRTTVDITQTGTFTVTFPTPVTVNQPAIWVGFYLPVNFQFLADSAGTSVLTYWAWTPNRRFDLASLANAQVLGPSDGTAPVGINMNGKARITAEITPSANAVLTPLTPGAPVVAQTTGDTTNISVLQNWTTCPDAAYDTADEFISLQDIVNVHCQEVPTWQAPSSPMGYARQGPLYDLIFYKQNGVVATDRLRVAITHCIRPDARFAGQNVVIGSAYGSPRRWAVLPTQRFGDYACAEVRHGGGLSYFVSTSIVTATPIPTSTPTSTPTP